MRAFDPLLLFVQIILLFACKTKDRDMTMAFAFRTNCMALAGLAAFAIMSGARAHADVTFLRGETQYIAALGDTAATSGNDAETWGFWSVDPGPRGVWISDYTDLVADAGRAPDGWRPARSSSPG